MTRPLLASHRQGGWGSSFVALALGLLVSGCGGSSGDGSSVADEGAPILRVNEHASEGFYTEQEPSPTPSLDPNTPLVEPAASSELCGGGFQACGGLLAGAWAVEGVCASDPPSRAALQRWAQNVLGLDAAACTDAVQAIDARWGGQLRFEEGMAIDLRRRSDTVEMSLSRDCLSKTFDFEIRAAQLGTACSTLTSDSIRCAVLNDTCQCTVRRERLAATSGTYGVLGPRVAIGSADGGHAVFDYCVAADLLEWKEPDTGQLLVLRRQGPASYESSY